MPRKYKPTDRFLKPDPKFNNCLATKFVNCLMRDGKKQLALRIFYDALDLVAERHQEKEPLDIFLTALNNVKPLLEVRSRRVGGATYQVPMPVRKKRQTALAIRWMLEAVDKKKGRATYLKLADEILSAYRKEGSAIQVRENVHKMAEANKAFAHFAW